MTEEQKRKKMLYDNEYNRRTLDRIVIQPQKKLNIPARLDEAVKQGKAKSKTLYIMDALLDRLEKDGL